LLPFFLFSGFGSMVFQHFGIEESLWSGHCARKGIAAAGNWCVGSFNSLRLSSLLLSNESLLGRKKDFPSSMRPRSRKKRHHQFRGFSIPFAHRFQSTSRRVGILKTLFLFSKRLGWWGVERPWPSSLELESFSSFSLLWNACV
jgi:hypothetical protein